jgi:hypothetical protein
MSTGNLLFKQFLTFSTESLSAFVSIHHVILAAGRDPTDWHSMLYFRSADSGWLLLSMDAVKGLTEKKNRECGII